jgi:hypothetical protein
MYTTVRMTTTVPPDRRIEVPVPDLPVGARVEVVVTVTAPPVRPGEPGILDFLKSLPPSQKTPEEWEQFERDFQAERDSWDR